MCLMIFAHRPLPGIPLAVAANRDEFHARPTERSGFWQQRPELLAGRDLEQGGTWMGVTRGGRFAAVTNFRDPDRTEPAPRSRGELPLDFLSGGLAPKDYLAQVAARGADYAGFNLLVGDAEQLWYFDNSPGETPEALSPGIYGLSNARLDTPWPKVRLGKARLEQTLGRGRWSHDDLGAVVADRGLADERELHGQGLNGEMDRMLSAQFIVSEVYGTRSSTSLWLENGTAHWRERSFDATGEPTGTVEEKFSLIL